MIQRRTVKLHEDGSRPSFARSFPDGGFFFQTDDVATQFTRFVRVGNRKSVDDIIPVRPGVIDGERDCIRVESFRDDGRRFVQAFRFVPDVRQSDGRSRKAIGSLGIANGYARQR